MFLLNGGDESVGGREYIGLEIAKVNFDFILPWREMCIANIAAQIKAL